MKKLNLAIILMVSAFSSSIYGQVFQPQTKEELQTAVNLWVDDNTTALENYGEINTWDVSEIVDMSGLFRNKNLFNSDISGWDVSSVTSMGAMFENASSFDGDISGWDVSNVTDMFGMFVNAASFSSDLSTWDVSNVTNMQGLFACYGCNSTFNSDLSSWDVSNVVNMRGMFSWITYNQDLSSWDVSNVGNMSEMFWGNNAFNQDLSTWDVSNVSNMSHMFQGSSSFDQNISEWNVSTVSNMKQMFQGSNAFNQDLSSWDVSNVSNMSNIFDGANSLTDENKCSIESTWSLNENWPYDWSSICATAPIVEAQFITINEDSPQEILLIGSDANGDVLTFNLETNPLNGTASISGNEVMYIPNTNYNGTDNFTFTASDGGLTSLPATVTITIMAINDLPVFSSTPIIDALDGTTHEYLISTEDIDGDDVIVTATTKPDWLAISDNNSSSLSFDGDDDYVEISGNDDLAHNNSFSLSALIRIPESNNNPWSSLVGGYLGYGYIVYAGSNNDEGKLRLEINDGNGHVTSNTDLRDGLWHDISVTFDGNLACVYIDGIKENESSISTNFSSSTSHNLKFGGINHNAAGNESFNGNISKVTIWDSALSESEVQSHMNTMLTGDEPGLVGYWDFNEGEGFTLTDLSGNGNNGTIHGAIWEFSSSTVLSGTPSHSDGGLHNIVLTAEDGNGGVATQSYTLAVSLHSLEVFGESSFRMFSSPVSGLIYEDLLEELWTQGAEGSDNPNSNPNIWTFENEWNSVTDFSADALAAGQGFLMYVYADTDFDGVDDLPVIISIDGEHQQSAVSVSSEPSAWNMMGNPYGLAVDISQMVSDNDGRFNKTVYALDQDNPGYKFHNGNIGTIDDGEIKPFEGFWIQATESGNTFQFTEQSIKKGSIDIPAGTSRDGSNGHAVFTFTNGTYSSSTYLSFTPEGEINLDPADADRLVPMSLVEHLTSMIYESNKSLAINNLPSDLTTDLTMDMDVMMLTPDDDNGYATQAEQIEFTWDISNLPEGITLGLTDNVTGQAIHLTEGVSTGISTMNKGSFETSGGFMGTYPVVGESQFTLTIYGITTAAVEDELLPDHVTLNGAYPNPFNPSTIISFDLRDADMVSLDIFDITGRQVATLVNEYMVPGNHQVSWNPGNLSSGLYLVNLVVGIETFNQKITYIK